MTCWPTRFDSQVWPMPNAPVTIGMATIPATSAVSSFVSFSGIAVSRTARSRNGEMIPRPAETRIRPSSASSCRRYGRNSRTTRPTGRGASGSGRCNSRGSGSDAPNLRNRRGACRGWLEGEVEDLADRHDRVERHLLTYILGQIVQIWAVALRQDHVGEPGGMRREHLLLEPADRQHSPLERDLAGHADRVLDRAVAEERCQ